jgi:hypothetical protein
MALGEESQERTDSADVVRTQWCRTTLSRELWTCIPSPSCATKPSFRYRFMKKLTRERVVPTISASDSWLILGITVSGLPSARDKPYGSNEPTSCPGME